MFTGQIGDDACTSCVQSNCCDAAVACQNDPTCSGCFNSGQTCDPTAATTMAFAACSQGPCATQCASTSQGAGGSGGSDQGAGGAAGSSSGGATSGACTDPQDMAATSASTFDNGLGNCGMMCFSKGMSCETPCVMALGLTMPCAVCWAANITCGIKSCSLQCIAPNSQACLDCNTQNCEPALEACAGM
jgi:hypothetical protein